MTTLSDEELQAARELCEKATPGKWTPDVGVYQDPDGDDDLIFARGPMVHRAKLKERWREQGAADCAFIAASRTLVPRLLDTIEALKAQVTAMTPVVSAATSIAHGTGLYAVSLAQLKDALDAYLAARTATISFGVSPVGTVSFRDGKLVP